MYKFTKITAIVLIVLGLMIILGGIGLGLAGLFRGGMHMAATAAPNFRMPMRPGVGGGFGLLAVFFAFIPGLALAGLGQGLYLLNEIAGSMPRSAAPGSTPSPAEQASAKG